LTGKHRALSQVSELIAPGVGAVEQALEHRDVAAIDRHAHEVVVSASAISPPSTDVEQPFERLRVSLDDGVLDVPLVVTQILKPGGVFGVQLLQLGEVARKGIHREIEFGLDVGVG